MKKKLSPFTLTIILYFLLFHWIFEICQYSPFAITKVTFYDVSPEKKIIFHYAMSQNQKYKKNEFRIKLNNEYLDGREKNTPVVIINYYTVKYTTIIAFFYTIGFIVYCFLKKYKNGIAKNE